jgi:hypothetical protein
MKKNYDAWPDDVDGAVFRQLRENGFNFQLSTDIDFNVDSPIWPPPRELIEVIRTNYPTVELYEPDDGDDGYLRFVVHEKLSYELVMFVQSSVTQMAEPFGAVCESWGVLQH